MSVQYYEGVGRRKESTAHVRLMNGSGKFMVNEKEAAAYFTRLGDLSDILMAFKACGEEAEKYDVAVTVKGGGTSGQTDAVKLGLARALVLLNGDWTPSLRKHGLLTRDARIKERKKPGLSAPARLPHIPSANPTHHRTDATGRVRAIGMSSRLPWPGFFLYFLQPRQSSYASAIFPRCTAHTRKPSASAFFPL